MRREFDGQIGFGHHHIAHKVGQRHFAGRNQIERGVIWLRFALLPAFFRREQIALEFRQLPRTFKRFAIHGIGNVTFGVTVFFGLHIEHELGKGAVQFGDFSFHHREARTG